MDTMTLFGVTFDPTRVARCRARIIAQARAEIIEAGVIPVPAVSMGDPDVIEIGGRGGGAPAFQFGPDGRLRPIVRSVARELDARHDPLGVAAWWLTEATWPIQGRWITARPVDLIGRDDEHILAAVAYLLRDPD